MPSTNLFGAAANATNASSMPSSAFAFGANKTVADTKPSLFTTPTTQSAGFGAFSSPTFGQTNAVPAFGSVTNAPATTTSTNLFGNAANAQNPPAFGATQPKTDTVFGIASNQSTAAPAFGSQNQTSTFGSSGNPPAFGTTNNLFGSSSGAQNPPAFGATTNMFSTPTTAANSIQTTNSAFGTPSGVFAFGQTQAPTPATTASTGIFGSANTSTNTNSPFVFGQTNSAQQATPSQPTGLFGAKPADNTNANASLTAPAAFGSTSPAFNFSAKPMFGSQPETKPAAFSFNATNTAPANVSAFGSAPAPTPTPQFGSSNGIGMCSVFQYDFHFQFIK